MGRWHLLRDGLPAARTQLTASIEQETGLRELAARALLHRVRTGQRDVLSAAADAVTGIDDPALHRDPGELSG